MKNIFNALALGAVLISGMGAALASDSTTIDCPSRKLPAGEHKGRFEELKFRDGWHVAKLLFIDDATETGYCLSIDPNADRMGARYAAIVNAYLLRQRVAIKTDNNQEFTAFTAAQD
ncbi:hypothetical protein N5W20_01965 [Candidatus Kirkpatrickella diaphorinae]|uniref:Uncharacterized protein n=1 Tax=Candidatus Kirkpatrickella diaphorinae TaxID=2984322 RepID=A0ABY6GJG7_9PROT|nr:hypothetical protein [Candidatus Kirkpatrickella diaphorinae]UYH51664.1 hypothetical protein N5W20_01965 [Candidatus Kirkpatrickella diaphorinae]